MSLHNAKMVSRKEQFRLVRTFVWRWSPRVIKVPFENHVRKRPELGEPSGSASTFGENLLNQPTARAGLQPSQFTFSDRRVHFGNTDWGRWLPYLIIV
ncbi:hypothetical protein NPIL_570931 [Nephila pilipes]|uniref:Uncharacterized protein n=1 Tax=Nephila pilipes TaxID=299642 RepID=A0A8X6U5A6_NEPPI|nr:hypothetical protein NPIL_570931 [Nephila pilipes]